MKDKIIQKQLKKLYTGSGISIKSSWACEFDYPLIIPLLYLRGCGGIVVEFFPLKEKYFMKDNKEFLLAGPSAMHFYAYEHSSMQNSRGVCWNSSSTAWPEALSTALRALTTTASLEKKIFGWGLSFTFGRITEGNINLRFAEDRRPKVTITGGKRISRQLFWAQPELSSFIRLGDI